MKKKKKIHKDKRGLEYIRESYFVGGKMKFRKVYVIDGIPSEEFYEKNATDIDHFKNGEYWLMSCEKDSNDDCEELSELKSDLSNDEIEDLPY
ncbi:MAG: hypothetical protein GQ564_03750 [Bacteroidales bacterium]|nr:hypothetical protein [Bacteroidales bacterium]